MGSSFNEKLFRALAINAEALATKVSENRFPVLLRPIAHRRRVSSVEFRPLLVDAILTVHSQGFRILFNSNGSNPVELQNRYDNESSDMLLHSRVRFSLAHELAHTLFYDLSADTPEIAKEFRSGGGKSALENLETACNKLAAHFLLPSSLLKTELLKLKTLDAQSLLNLSRVAGVSMQTLIRRIGQNSALLAERYFRGCILLVKQNSTETVIAAAATPKGITIADDLRLMRAGERWHLLSSSGVPLFPQKLSSPQKISLSASTKCSTIRSEYYVTILETFRTTSSVSYLMTFEDPLSL